MRRRARGETNRGTLRGFFVLLVCSGAAFSCDKSAPADGPAGPTPDAAALVPQARDATPDVGASEVAVAPTEVPPPALRPPWTDPPVTLSALEKSLPAEPIGTLTGVIFGESRPVRAVVRAACGAGTVLQAVYENEEGRLMVTPGMAVRFLGLPSNAASYQDAGFDVTVHFPHDDSDRLQGTLDIRYEEHGEVRSYAKLVVDGDPLETLLEPRLSGDGNVPMYEHCLPAGYALVVEGDGTEHRGYLSAIHVPESGAIILRLLLAEGSGLQIIVGLRDPKKPIVEPLKLTLTEARKPGPGQEAVAFVEAFDVAELAPHSEATGINVGSEKTVNAREGLAEFSLTKVRGKWYLDMTLSDVAISTLIDGPLRGKKLSKIRIAAWPAPRGTAPAELGTAPAWWSSQE